LLGKAGWCVDGREGRGARVAVHGLVRAVALCLELLSFKLVGDLESVTARLAGSLAVLGYECEW
jgi:hypothetical protein